ncbi:patatin-like phospholipase family protein [Microbulbifer epialgicus]|uniref:Patatin-like phospholipase family protein n=1 Tax=Microbulbifer epialgicus TaxID=393907 RepID=A0ABV4P451_9GAMM
MFEQMVFGGGGGRCIWQLGFILAVRQEIRLTPSVVCAASAGAMVAGVMLMERCEEAVDYFHRACLENPGNIIWKNLIRQEPVFPHFAIYKKGVHDLFCRGFDRLRASADLRVGVIHPPTWLPPSLALATGVATYHIDKRLISSLHPTFAFRLGFRQVFYRARDCKNISELEHLFLSSCCNPPFSPRLYLNGKDVLDGGAVGRAPVAGLDSSNGRVLVLDTGCFPGYPRCFSLRKGDQLRTYVQPSRRLPIGVWNFSDPQILLSTLEIGLADGRAFLEELSAEGISVFDPGE